MSGDHEDMKRTVRLGSVISGTLRLEDLATAFADALEPLDHQRRYATLIDEARRGSADPHPRPHPPDEDGLAEIVDDLTDALGEFAPPYCYFGTHPGDGADFGFWPDWDAIQADRYDGSLRAGDELPEDGSRIGQYLHVSDHGNAELYSWDDRQRRWESEWGVV